MAGVRIASSFMPSFRRRHPGREDNLPTALGEGRGDTGVYCLTNTKMDQGSLNRTCQKEQFIISPSLKCQRCITASAWPGGRLLERQGINGTASGTKPFCCFVGGGCSHCTFQAARWQVILTPAGSSGISTSQGTW